ncbi:MAG: anti-sigma factor [Rhizobiales bacterium]|nr:anti-sigma factor [Hyphomicrobiales bacterium]
MAGLEDLEGLAAEYVLGTLERSEREDAERAMALDAGLAGLVAGWERRLIPLALSLEPVAAPAYMRDKIMAAIPRGDAGQNNVVALERRANRWRGAAIGSWAIAAALAGVILFRPPEAALQGGRYVAVLQSEGLEPAFLASIDLASGMISVLPVAATTPSGKSYELWALGAGRDKPQSLGVIDANFRVPAGTLGKVDTAALGDTLFAVSLEPEGGSPTGQPTGPVMFTGKLVATE